MSGINPSNMVHPLNVSLSFPPIRLNKRVFVRERDKLIAKKVHSLQEAGFIREVYYHDWLDNVVMVKMQTSSVCGFHQLEQSMLEGQPSSPMD